jgi:ribonuclease HI
MLKTPSNTKHIILRMAIININAAEIYTDGSCHTQLKTGAWAAIILTSTGKQTLSGLEYNTTHNRMEITAVIKAIEYIYDNHKQVTYLKIISDSQYVTGLPSRAEKLQQHAFITSKGNELQNADIIKELLRLTTLFTIDFIKVKAHQRSTEEVNYNREADILCRQLVRNAVKKP